MIKIIYVGKDDSYFNGLKKAFLKVEGEVFEFKQLWHDDQDRFQTLADEVVKELPNIAFLDYSGNTLKMLTVARSLPRLFERGPSLIGLWDYQAKKEYVKESLTLGIPFFHYKAPEYSDIVQQSLFLYKGGAFPEGQFAKAEIVKRPAHVTATSLFRIGFLTEKYLHVEHDILPPQKDSFPLEHSFDEEFPIEHFRMERRLDFNYYYEMNFSSDLSYVFLDPSLKEAPEAKEGDNKNTKKKAFWQDRAVQTSIDSKKRQIKKYVNKHQNNDAAKRTRLMIIDPEMNVVRQAMQPLDSYPHSIRFYRSIHNKKNLINRIRPGILCYQCPEKDEGELGDIMLEVEKVENFNPFVVIFRSSRSSEHLQKHYSYSRIIAWNETFSLNQLLTFCEKYEKGEGRMKTHDQRISFHDKESRYYIRKDSAESFLEYRLPVELKAVCETWIKFRTEHELPLWSILHLELPVPLYMTVIEVLDEKDWAKAGYIQYRAVVHGLGERERSHLRVAVNDLIHQEILAEKEKEAEEAKAKAEEAKKSQKKD
jgi:hypothetical protein